MRTRGKGVKKPKNFADVISGTSLACCSDSRGRARFVKRQDAKRINCPRAQKGITPPPTPEAFSADDKFWPDSLSVGLSLTASPRSLLIFSTPCRWSVGVF